MGSYIIFACIKNAEVFAFFKEQTVVKILIISLKSFALVTPLMQSENPKHIVLSAPADDGKHKVKVFMSPDHSIQPLADFIQSATKSIHMYIPGKICTLDQYLKKKPCLLLCISRAKPPNWNWSGQILINY